MGCLMVSLKFRTAIAVAVIVVGVVIQLPASATIGTTVTFVAYDGQLPVPSATQVAQVDGSVDLTLFGALFPSLVYPGHTFDYWSTQSGGGGDVYGNGASYPFASSATLYAQWIGPNHTVTFNENSSLNDPVQSSQVANLPTPLTQFTSLQPSFANPNFTFLSWNTKPDGTGTSYGDGTLYNFVSAIALYAQWSQDPHAVTFFSNLTSSDTTHVIQTANAPVALTSISALSYSNLNYTFEGWNTQRNGNGVAYLDQAAYPFSADITLYAQWSPDQYNLSFSSNTGTGSVPSIGAPYGSAVTLPQGTSMSKLGFQLVGWNTDSQGNGTEYQLGATINVKGSETLYAKWSQLSCVILFATPGIKGKVAPITDAVGKPIQLRSSNGLVKPGFTFAGWFSSVQGGNLVGRGGAMFTPSASLTLFAQWTSNPLVGLEFSDNGGVGHVPARQVQSGLAVVIPGGAGIHRTGYLFRGWASSSRAPQPTVHIGTRLVLTHTKILYALWRHQLSPRTPQVLLGSVGIFASNSSALTPKMRQYIASLALSVDQHNRTTLVLYGYATSMDSAKGSALLSLQRALAVQKQLDVDLANLNDVGVTVRAVGEGRLSNSVLASFRNVEVFAN